MPRSGSESSPSTMFAGRRRILVAEDHPVNRRLVGAYLDKLGLDHEIVNDGQDAVDAFRRSSFDLVLMDINMPVLRGTDAVLRIRELEGPSETHVPIISMSASVEEEDLTSFEVAGGDGHLSKPMRLPDLRACLLKWMPAEQEPREEAFNQ